MKKRISLSGLVCRAIQREEIHCGIKAYVFDEMGANINVSLGLLFSYHSCLSY